MFVSWQRKARMPVRTCSTLCVVLLAGDLAGPVPAGVLGGPARAHLLQPLRRRADMDAAAAQVLGAGPLHSPAARDEGPLPVPGHGLRAPVPQLHDARLHRVSAWVSG